MVTFHYVLCAYFNESYDKEKIANNKTRYKIADENIKSLVVGLLNTDPLDSSIITYVNDINSISILNDINNKSETQKFKPADLIYITLI